MNNLPWECPKCSVVMAPNTLFCLFCKPKKQEDNICSKQHDPFAFCLKCHKPAKLPTGAVKKMEGWE